MTTTTTTTTSTKEQHLAPLGYDNNVSPYSSQCEHVLYSVVVCGHIPDVLVIIMCSLISIATMICLMQDGGTALFMASQEGHSAIATLLLDRGAQVDTQTKVYNLVQS